MIQFRRLIVAFALAMALASCVSFDVQAQGCGPQNANCIVPTAPVGTSDNRAASTAFVQNQIASGVPYADISGLPAMSILGSIAGSNAAALTPTQVTTFCNVFSSSLSGCVPAPASVSGRYLGDDAAWHALPAAATQTIVQGSGIALSGTCSGAALNCTVSAPSSVQLTLSSRAFAFTQDLSALTTVQTLGYSTGGDGGGAIFQKIAGNFIDTQIVSGTLTANGTSGCTNGTYYGVDLDGGSGRGAKAVVTVSGGVITVISMGRGGRNSAIGYAAGDVLSIGSTIPGCSGAKTWTVSTVTTPTGSFTDSAGNKWQIQYPAAGLDVRAFGVKFDWDGNDGTATNNTATLQNAVSFAGYRTATISDLGGSVGGQVLLAKQTALYGCGVDDSLIVPQGVKIKGQGNYTSVIKFCDTFNAASNQVELCDKDTHLACFGSLLEDFQIFNSASISGISSRSVVYTDNAQHEAGMRRMVIYPGGCGRGATYETGFGGATYILMDSVEYKGGKSHANCGGANGPEVLINYGTTQVLINNLNLSGFSSGSGGPRLDGLVISGGFVDIVGIHSEQVINPVTINIPSLNNGQVRAREVIGGVDCVGMFTLTGTNAQGNFMLGPPNAVNGCARLVSNGQAGGSNLTGPVLTDTIFNP
ncbi:hypothetical protein [Bradyrhizobium zhanjiangense]|uniref:Lipoprotein n=1 Tax=Bradyrhizobium zhanjiangense TaxID=1325107 RepID=A0A4Q0SA27_9BRAD|nr:hypothetical protein [Bradyrhizobium zhanjiangense]RXH32006.1 hypothetical protein XH94_32610 [Bradyrhizobium zhanjiangense]